MNSKKIFWIALGSISLGVGVIGAFIPLLPSFPFYYSQHIATVRVLKDCTTGLSTQRYTKIT